MYSCEDCVHQGFCAIEHKSLLSSEGTFGVAYPNIEGAMLSIIDISNRRSGYIHDYNGYFRLINVRVPGGCAYILVHARYNPLLGCYIFIKEQLGEKWDGTKRYKAAKEE